MSPGAKPARRFLPFLAVLAVAAVVFLTVAAVFTLWNIENRSAQVSFDKVAQERFDALATDITLTLHSLASLGAFLDSSPGVDRAQFARFANGLREQNDAIRALEWVPRTPQRLRADRENSAHRDGFPSFQFVEFLPDGQLAKAGGREEYLPIFFVEPLEGNERHLGLDLASAPAPNEALQRAVSTGSLAATCRVRHGPNTGDQYRFLVFRPVYQGGVQPSSEQERRERLTGYALAEFLIGDMIEKVGAVAKRAHGFQVAVFDLEAQPGARLLYPKGARFDAVEDLPAGFRVTREMPVAGRRWMMAAYPGPHSFRPVRWSSGSALAAGFFLTALLAGYLRLNRRQRVEIEHRHQRLEEIVELRTADLEAKENQLRLLLESTAEAIYGIDLQGRCTFCNPACLRLLGYERAEDLLGQDMHEQIHHSHPDGTAYPAKECRIHRAFQKGEGTHVTDEVLWKADGTSFPAEYWSYPQRRDGEVVGAVVTFVDITESKRAEETLRLAQTSVEQASDAVFWLDSPGRFLYVNGAACRSLGRSREELLSLSIGDIVPDLQPEDWTAAWEKVKAAGSITFETRHRTSEGRIFPVEISLTHVEFGGKEYAFRFARDITLRKQIEKDLRESENYVTALLAAMPVGVVVLDAETHRTTDVNAFALTLMGREREQVIGSVCHGSLCNTPRGQCPITDLHEKLDHSERTLRRADGSTVPILKSVVPLVRQGRTYLVEAFADLSDQKRAQIDLRKAKEAAEAADRAKSAFLANMSHEIRTPMNAILGYSQLMLRDPSLAGAAKKNLNIINRSGEHLLGLINDILVMSKIEAGRMDLNPVAFDLASLVTDLAAMFRLRAEAKELHLDVRMDAEPGRLIVADQGKLREVLINLLGNAIKFTEEGWIGLRVSLEPRSGGQVALAISVEDTGAGISAAEQFRLFRPFVQAQSGVASQGGTGLGLAISREFVRLMGGDITVSSEVGKGSVFHFEIPVQAASGNGLPAQPAPGPVAGLMPGQAARILIVDDDPCGRGWLLELLRSIGFEVREAAGGEAAIGLWQEWKPELILMDIRMPGMNGLEAARRIKAEANGKPPAIVALTASALDGQRDAVMSGGIFDDFVSKPCREGELLEKIGAHLNLEYRYGGGETAPATDGCGAPGPATGARLLAKLPADCIDRLRHAVLNGEKDRIDRLIRGVEELDAPAARSLQEVADRYEYDVLAGWFADAVEAGTAGRVERT